MPASQVAERIQTPRFWPTAIVLLITSAMGPYVTAGLRTDHFVVYPLAALGIIALLGARTPRSIVLLLSILTLLLAIATISTTFRPANTSPWPFGSQLSGFDNLAQPLAAIIITSAACSRSSPQLVLQWACRTIVTVALINVALAIAMSIGTLELSAWWSSSSDSSGLRSLQQGRTTGVINHPAEAGLLYGIAMIAGIYLWRPHKRFLFSVVLGMLLLGGMLTASKVFLFGSLPIAALQYLARRGHRGVRLAGPPILIGAFAAVPGTESLLSRPLEQFGRQFQDADSNLLGSLTANRLGSDSTLGPIIDALVTGPFWFGYGAQGLRVPYDNGWVEMLVVAGIAGVVCYAALFAVPFIAWRSMPRGTDSRSLLGALTALTMIASMGIPALTANRVALLLWILFTTLLFVAARAPTPSGSPTRAAATTETQGGPG